MESNIFFSWLKWSDINEMVVSVVVGVMFLFAVRHTIQQAPRWWCLQPSGVDSWHNFVPSIGEEKSM